MTVVQRPDSRFLILACHFMICKGVVPIAADESSPPHSHPLVSPSVPDFNHILKERAPLFLFWIGLIITPFKMGFLKGISHV